MSDRVIQSCHDSGERARQPLHSYQSLWMSRWAGASCNTALQEQNQLSSPLETDEVDHGTKQLHLPSGVEIASDISDSAKEFREVKTRNFEIINEGPITSSRNLRDDTPSSQESPIINISQKSGSNFVWKNDQQTNDTKVLKLQFSQNFEHGNTALRTSGRQFPSIPSVAPLETETSSKECHIQHQSLSQNLKDRVKSRMIFGSSFAFTRSSQDDFTGTASHVFPKGLDLGECRFDRGRSSEQCLIHRQEKVNHLRSILASKKHLPDTNLTILEQDKCNYHNDSTVLVGKQKMDNCSTSGKSVIPYLRKDNDSSMFLNDPPRNSGHSLAFCDEKYQEVQNHSGIGLSPSWSSPPEATELETLHHGCCLHTKPSSKHDAKTMGICTSVDSVEGVSGSRPRIFQTTHSLLITKTTDVNLCKENHIFRELGVLDQLKENSSSELHSFSPLFGHSQRGVKLCEGKENVQDVDAFEVVPKNELSTETDTMNMANFKENHLSGGNSSPSNKDIIVETDSPPNNAIASAGEVRLKRPIPELPDINIELPSPSVEENSMDNADPSTSKTQTLDVDLLHAEQPNNAKADHCLGSHLEPDWSRRWIKRLKLSASGSFSIGEQPNNAKADHCLGSHLEPEWSRRWIKRLKLSASDSFSIGTKSLNLGEVRLKRPIPELPDINIELPSPSVEENSMDNADPSTSKTTLDVDLLHAEQPNNAKADHCLGSHLEPEWSRRWIKRLKLSASGSFSIGTKSLNLGEATSHEKVNKFFSRIITGGITNSDLTLAKSAGKELMVLHQKTASIKNGESSSVHNLDNGDDITLSNFWIQRWLHNRAATPQKKPEAVVVCEPQSSKVTLEDFNKRQFPSIAAMALMGKAMNGFQPCEFQNKGPFIVWNTKCV